MSDAARIRKEAFMPSPPYRNAQLEMALAKYIEKDSRKQTALNLGLPETASWDEISMKSDDARKTQAVRLGLPNTAS